ncbi:hypothetical protein ACWIGI_28315 [Nocardia sp. NPDC055321]
MGKRQPVDRSSSRRRRIGSLAIAGALPLVAALGSAGTAAAEPVPTEETQPAATEPQTGLLDTPFGQFAVPAELRGLIPAAPPAVETAPVALDVEPAAETEQVVAAEPAVAEVAPVVYVGRDSATGVRQIPNAPLAAVDFDALRMPDPAAARAVAPIAAPEGKLRFGDTQVDIPTWLTPEQAAQINGVSARAEADLAASLDSAGFEASRSDRIAAQTIGNAAVGAVVGVGVAAPVEIAAAAMGGLVGALAGTPFAPFGWFFGPTIGATAAVALVAVPAAAVGAGIGAAVGAANGVMAPAEVVPAG